MKHSGNAGCSLLPGSLASRLLLSLPLMMLPRSTEVLKLRLFSSVMQLRSLAPISVRAEFGPLL